MNNKFYISLKDEAYTYDELGIILAYSENIELNNKLTSYMKLIEDKRNCKAVFFMPEQSFNIFALLNAFDGTYEINKITEKDILYLIDSLQKKKLKEEIGEKLISHLIKKLNTLYSFLKDGNKVNAVSIEDDKLTVI